MSHANWKTIRSNVNELAHEGLVGLVKELYNLNAQNQTFLEARFGNQQNGLEEYKRIIEENICPNEPWKRDISLSAGRQAIRDYKKARGDPEGLIDLMIFYCECGVFFTNKFVDICKRFYTSMESMYEEALKLLKQHSQCQELFLTRIQLIVNNTRSIGWGFHDALSDMFGEYQRDVS